MFKMATDAVGGCDKFEALWWDAGAAPSRKDWVKKAVPLSVLHLDGDHYESFRFETIPCYMSSEIAVAVGVVHSDPGAALSDRFVLDAAEMVKRHQARCVACVFGERVEKLCEAVIGPDGPTPFTPLFQLWRKEQREQIHSCGGSSSNTAVAERWGLEPTDASNYMVHPACLVFFGRAQDISEV